MGVVRTGSKAAVGGNAACELRDAGTHQLGQWIKGTLDPPFNRFFKEVCEEIPSMTAMRYFDLLCYFTGYIDSHIVLSVT